jgi:hypothetical protein
MLDVCDSHEALRARAEQAERVAQRLSETLAEYVGIKAKLAAAQARERVLRALMVEAARQGMGTISYGPEQDKQDAEDIVARLLGEDK